MAGRQGQRVSSARICFLVGSLAISGGTYVIVQHAAHLRRSGYEVTLAVQEPFDRQTLAWHDELGAMRCLPLHEARAMPFDLVIATWWKTAFELHGFEAGQYAYFVQSIESRFYPRAEQPLRALVDATYTFDLAYVTEATWIQSRLEKDFGHRAALVRNGIRKDVYRHDGACVEARPRPGTAPRVLIEGHFGVPFKNTALGLRLAKEAGLRDLWVLTGSPVRWLPGVRRVFSRVPMFTTPAIYRSCDILVKLSTVEGMFGPPLEMFHCGGTSVVFDVSGHDEYIVDGVNAAVVRSGDMDAVVTSLRELAERPDRLAQLKQGALETARQWQSWEESSSAFRSWVDGVLGASTPTDRQVLADMTAQAYEAYGQAERERQAANRAIVRRHRLSGLAARLPPSCVAAVKQFEAIREVLHGARRVN